MYSIAGIGSRKTPPAVLADMFKIGEWCKDMNITLRSGHCDGADWWFEQGAQQNCVAYLPWKSFNNHLISNANMITFEPDANTIAIARKYHPAYDRLSSGAKKMIGRNVWQILSPTLNDKVQVVVCWTNGGKLIGGTAQALRIAKDYGIPIINMGAKRMPAEEVITILKTIISF